LPIVVWLFYSKLFLLIWLRSWCLTGIFYGVINYWYGSLDWSRDCVFIDWLAPETRTAGNLVTRSLDILLVSMD